MNPQPQPQLVGPERILFATALEITSAMQDSLERRRIMPALILMYSGIDILGALLRPHHECEDAQKHFVQWASCYMLKRRRLLITADDLWGARCGLLHTNRATSRHSKKGKAKELCYVLGFAKLPIALKQELQSQADGKVLTDVEELCESFVCGVVEFGNSLEHDLSLKALVLRNASQMLAQTSNLIPKEK